MRERLRAGWTSTVCALALAATTSACAPGTNDDPAAQESDLSGASRICSGEETVDGIDVSYFQEQIDWHTVADTSTRFAIIRVAYGAGFKDPRFEENWAGAKEAGLIRGLYQYYRPSHDPLEQAQLVIDSIAHDPLRSNDLPVVLDFETTEERSTEAIREDLHIWLQAVEDATGKRPLIYAAAFMQDVLGDEFSDYPLWVANYTTQCPKVPKGWDSWRMWQYTDQGQVDGIVGDVDRNLFDGSLDDLLAFAEGSTTGDVVDPGEDDPPTPVGAPTNLQPGDGDHIEDVAVELSCDPYAGATSYVFQVDEYDDGADVWVPLITFRPSEPSQVFWPPSSGMYRVRVTAKLEGGRSEASDWHDFTFVLE